MHRGDGTHRGLGGVIVRTGVLHWTNSHVSCTSGGTGHVKDT